MRIRCLPAICFSAGLAFALHATASDLAEAIEQDYEYLGPLFEHFHANPELSMQEFKTAERLAQELESLGFALVRDIAGPGLAAIMENGEGPRLMIRADMDALPVLEKTGLPYASTVRQVNLEGVEMPVMHACGHDMHITSLVGVARRMVETGLARDQVLRLYHAQDEQESRPQPAGPVLHVGDKCAAGAVHGLYRLRAVQPGNRRR